jgi:hypothetical protein
MALSCNRADRADGGSAEDGFSQHAPIGYALLLLVNPCPPTSPRLWRANPVCAAYGPVERFNGARMFMRETAIVVHTGIQFDPRSREGD